MPEKKRPTGEIFQVKVALRGSKPPIWRRLLLPAKMKLIEVHAVIQTVMGWYDSHLHEFSSGKRSYGVTDPLGESVEDGKPTDETRVRLNHLLPGIGAKALYTYDFGDGWEHTIELEKVLPTEHGQKYPWCTGGKRACPPEDCGGIWGYRDLLSKLQDPAGEEDEELVEWVGRGFDPGAFSADAVNRMLHAR